MNGSMTNCNNQSVNCYLIDDYINRAKVVSDISSAYGDQLLLFDINL